MPDDPYLGEVCLWPAASMIPRGWLPCDGRMLPLRQYPALFGLLGTAYGGDGKTQFALPDMRGRTPVGQSATLTDYQRGVTGGVEHAWLIAENLPQHDHAVGASSADATSSGIKSAIPAVAGAKLYAHATPDTAIDPRSLAPTGGSGPHDNMQPYLAMTYIIAATGLYPEWP